MKKVLIIGLVGIIMSLVFLFAGKYILAENGVTDEIVLGVSPTIIEQVLTPGETQNRKIRLFNLGNRPLSIKVQIRDFVGSIDSEIEVSQAVSAKKWISVDPSDFIIDPQQSKEISISVSPPINATPGGHYASIIFNPVVPVDLATSSQPKVLTRVSVQALYLVKGEILESLKIAEFKAKKYFFWDKNHSFWISLKNEGNVHLVPKGYIKVEPIWFGEKREEIFEKKVFLPKDTRRFSLEMAKSLPFGNYKAELSIVWGSENKTTVLESADFWVIPWEIALICLLTPLVLIFMMKYMKRIKLLALGVLATGLLFPKSAHAATLTGSDVTLSDPRPSQVGVTYTMDWDNVTTSTIKCMKVSFSTVATGITVPTGMTTTGASYDVAASDYVPDAQTWSTNATVNGTVGVTSVTGEIPASASGRTLVLNGITNGSVVDTRYFVLFNTYNNTDCATSPVDSGVGVIIFTNGQVVSLTIDPTISFTVNAVSSGTVNSTAIGVTTTSTTIPFGTVGVATNGVAAHDLTVGTNAGSGYTVYTRYTGTLTNLAGATIPDHTGTNAVPTSFSAPGTAAFGYTSEDFTLGTGTAGRFNSNNWAKFTTANLEVAYSPNSVNNETTRVGYQVGVSNLTAAGNYTTTVIMTVVPSF